MAEKRKKVVKTKRKKSRRQECGVTHYSVGHRRDVRCELTFGHVGMHWQDLGNGSSCQWIEEDTDRQGENSFHDACLYQAEDWSAALDAANKRIAELEADDGWVEKEHADTLEGACREMEQRIAELESELASLRAAPSDAEIDAWEKRADWYARQGTIRLSNGDFESLVLDGVALMRRAKAAPSAPSAVELLTPAERDVWRQRVPIIVQRDKAEKERDAIRAKLGALVEAAEKAADALWNYGANLTARATDAAIAAAKEAT